MGIPNVANINARWAVLMLTSSASLMFHETVGYVEAMRRVPLVQGTLHRGIGGPSSRTSPNTAKCSVHHPPGTKRNGLEKFHPLICIRSVPMHLYIY